MMKKEFAPAERLPVGEMDALIGARHGEAAGCVRSALTEGGCGTPAFCQTCGAVQSILNSQRNNAVDVKECCMVCGETEEPLEEISARRMLSAAESGELQVAVESLRSLEVVGPGESMTVNCFTEGDEVCFAVHNAIVMPPEVRRQLFTRSFSTKGSGRGLGTYSIKLITEKYLRGRVSFVSDEEQGTVFTVRYPRVIEEVRSDG